MEQRRLHGLRRACSLSRDLSLAEMALPLLPRRYLMLPPAAAQRFFEMLMRRRRRFAITPLHDTDDIFFAPTQYGRYFAAPPLRCYAAYSAVDAA